MSDSKSERDVILQVLLTRTESGGYEAHCLQMDIVTEAPTLDQATNDICDLIRAQYCYGRDTHNLESVFVPAPAEDWQKLAHAKPIGDLRSIDVSRRSEHCEEEEDDTPSYAIQELEVAHA